MTQILYYWDESQHLEHSELYMDEVDLPNPLPVNATTVAPENGLYEPISWDGGTWSGTDKETWLVAHPVPAPEPTTEQQMIMQQAVDITQLQQLAMDQASQIAGLSKGSAE